MLKKFPVLLVLLFMMCSAKSQTTAMLKKELDTTRDPIGLVKFKYKKKFKLDTVTIVSTTAFAGFADSLAYNGKVGKVYGPFKGKNYLVKILGKVPNTFYHLKQILLDTSTFSKVFADSLATKIMNRIQSGDATFESMVRTYSSDNFSIKNGGDMGWFIREAMLPQMDKAISTHKKGDLFKVWTDAGLHIVTFTDDPKKDNGFVLILRVFL